MTKLLAGLFALSSIVSLGPACKREAPPEAETPRDPSAVAPMKTAEAPAEAAAAPAEPSAVSATPPASATAEGEAGNSHYTTDKFELVLKPNGSYAKGQQGKVEIVLDAKPPFHVNKEYPYKFKAKEGPGVKYPKPVVGKDAAKLEEQRVTLPVEFVPESAGKHEVTGQFAFSVCTPENCLIEKRDLALVVDVK